VTSVGATAKARLKKPIVVKRPKQQRPQLPPALAVKKAVGVLAATTRG